MINFNTARSAFPLLMLSYVSYAQTKKDWGRYYEKLAWQKAQEPTENAQFIKDFVRIFNSENLSDLLQLMAPSFKTSEEGSKTIDFLKFHKVSFGTIESLYFKYFDTRNQRTITHPLAVYTLMFDQGSVWEMRIGLNEVGQLDRLIITDNNYNESEPQLKSSLRLTLPFHREHEWFVRWGGLTHEDNHHVTSRAQKNAIDFLIKNKHTQKTFQSNGKSNTDYYAYDQPIYAPADGKVVQIIDGIEDNIPGTMNTKQLTGNTVIIEAEGEFIMLAHLKNGSIEVEEGENVYRGELLAKCGNSGNSSEPHLHLQINDKFDLKKATGLEMIFDRLQLKTKVISEYSPLRGDYLRTVDRKF